MAKQSTRRDTWIIKDDRYIAQSLDLSIHHIAAHLERDPLDVLRHLADERAQGYLAKAGHPFAFEPGSEEEAELVGLCLSGVPLGAALLWCAADADRVDAATLKGMMPEGDLRPAIHQARELGIWFSRADEVDDLQYLEESMPAEITQAAIEDLLSQFQPPTPGLLRLYVEGQLPAEKGSYAFLSSSSCSSASTRRSYGSKSRSHSYSKPRRSSYKRYSKPRAYRRSRSRAYA
jgi:hypothetical protein